MIAVLSIVTLVLIYIRHAYLYCISKKVLDANKKNIIIESNRKDGGDLEILYQKQSGRFKISFCMIQITLIFSVIFFIHLAVHTF